MMNIFFSFVLSAIIFSFSPDTTVSQTMVDRLDKTKLERIITDRNGKVLLLNLWATWCVPCREEIPDLVKLSNEFKIEVEVIGISIDFPDEIKSKIIPFLKKNKVSFKNFVNGFSNDEDLINAIEENWNGALPATVIYNSSGKKIVFLDGKKSYTAFKEELMKAIKLN